MERTQEELKRLLVGRKVSVRRDGMERTEGNEFTVRDVTVFHTAVVLGCGEDESGYVRMRDVDGLLDGQECTFGNGAARLLPVEEGPTKEGPEPAKAQEAPAKPALTHDWQKRWWQFYYHFITADETSAEEAASMADEAITVARKHLEGE